MHKYGFIFFSLIIIAIFFGGFFLYYVPSNRETENKYGFLVLQNIESGLQMRIAADIELYTNNLSGLFQDSGIVHKKLWKADSALRGLNAYIYYASNNKDNQHISPVKINATTGRPNGQLINMLYDSMIFLINGGRDSVKIYTPLKKFFGDILQPHKNDFYQYFIFMRIDDSVSVPVYHSEGLRIGTEIDVDSLLPGSKNAFYPGISDIPVGDASYKMFYIPVSINGKNFALCGFRKAGEYQAALHDVPTKFIYPIVILLLLLLTAFPLIKIYVMDPGERLKIWDLAGLISALFFGSMFLTLVSIQLFLLNDGEARSRFNLKNITDQLSNSFGNELSFINRFLEGVDRLPLQDSIYPHAKDLKTPRLVLSKSLINWLAHKVDKDSLYLNFDRVSWVDSNGMQIFKAQIDGQAPLFTNISTRNFYRDFASGNLIRLHGDDHSLFSMEAIYNWIDGSFRIVVARKSHCPPAKIIQVATIMHSFIQTILPPGYGFCMIREDGIVQVHSDSSHNLNENFLDELSDNRALKGAMRSRQELFIPHAKFYGKENALLITPVAGMPYYLIAFYDTGNIQPVNTRILIFSFLFSFATLLVCVFLGLLIFWRKYGGRPLLFTTIDYMDWIVPRMINARIYFHAFVFLVVYFISILSLSLLTNKYAQENNHIVLILLLQAPFTLSTGLLVASRPKARDPLSGWVILLLTLIYIGFGISIHDFQWRVLFQLFLIDFLLLALLVNLYLFPGWLERMYRINRKNYFFWYSLLIEALVISLPVLTAALFSWYARNQEILQETKKNQLCLAFSLEDRQGGIYTQLQSLGDSVLPASQINNLRYHQGIYSTTDQVILPGNNYPLLLAKTDIGYEKFYFGISDQISNDYYSNGYLPALKDHARDSSWKWELVAPDSMSFLYQQKPGTNGLLNIRSSMKAPYPVLNLPGKILFWTLLILAVLFTLYLLILRLSENLFLKKYVFYAQKIHAVRLAPLSQKYIGQNPGSDLSDAAFDFEPVLNQPQMNQFEQYVVAQVQKEKEYYQFVLLSCTASEKYLLYNFSVNGFINFKNVAEIYKLLDKGILYERQSEIRMFSLGFRAYILRYYSIQGHQAIVKTMKKKSAWQSFKTPFMVLLIVVAAFVFFTQQDTWQRFSALLTGLGTSIPLLFGLFKNTPPAAKDS